MSPRTGLCLLTSSPVFVICPLCEMQRHCCQVASLGSWTNLEDTVPTLNCCSIVTVTAACPLSLGGGRWGLFGRISLPLGPMTCNHYGHSLGQGNCCSLCHLPDFPNECDRAKDSVDIFLVYSGGIFLCNTWCPVLHSHDFFRTVSSSRSTL